MYPGQPGQARPSSRPSSGTIVAIAPGALLLILILAGGGLWWAKSQHTAEALVRDYVEAIADGRADDATDMIPLMDSGDVDLTYLRDSYLLNADSRITIDRVWTSQAPDGAQAVVSVGYSLDGASYRFDFEVVRTGKTLGILDHWEIRTPMVSQMSIATGGIDYYVFSGGSSYLDTNSTLTYFVYPALYSLTLSNAGIEDTIPVQAAAQPDAISSTQTTSWGWTPAPADPARLTAPTAPPAVIP